MPENCQLGLEKGTLLISALQLANISDIPFASPWRRMMPRVLLLMSVLAAATASGAERTDYTAFQRAVAASFEKLAPAVCAYVACQDDPKSHFKATAEIERQRREAVAEFRKQVAAHWPYHDPELKKQQQASEVALREIRSLFNRAKGGEPPSLDRDKAVHRMLQLAQSFPNSPVSDEARFFAGYLFWDVKPRREDEGFELMRTVNASTGPLSRFRIMAMGNLASRSDSDEQRVQDRQRFSATLREIRDPTALKRRLLDPLQIETQDRYVERVVGTLTTIENSYALNASNMVVDSMRTAEPQESIDRLRKSEAGNPYLEREIKRRGLDKPLTLGNR
ncbi:MAG: hypothetical protein ACLQLG_07380 [Thermoguttaceae bacterium]